MKIIRPFLSLPLLLAACAAGSLSPTAAPATATPPAPTATALPSPASSPTATALPTSTATAVPTATATATTAPTPPPGPLNGAALVEALRNGGYVIFFRHAATAPSPDDAVPVVLEDCATQRNLSEAGRAQARQIGEDFRRLGIPVGQVLSSPFCRALDTARLAFDRAEAEPSLENLETAADETEREARVAGVRRLLAAPPEPGTNTVLASHGFNLNAAAQVSVPEGGAAIFRPDGAGGFELVATVRAEEWANFLVPP